VREAAFALYGFCRLSDDAVDVQRGGAAAIAEQRARLDAIYAGRPSRGAVDRALADVVRTYGLPRAPLDALLEGLSWDAEGRRYETLGDVQAYGARVAGAVGVLMAVLMGVQAPGLLARACDLGVAMQLTNIARDVGEDAREGRLYLPAAWMREVGLDPDAWLARPVFGPPLASVVQRLLRRADELYRRADAGIAGLSPRFRPAIYAARLLYAEIGAVVAARGFDSVASRASVSTRRKLVLAARALARAHRLPTGLADAPPLDETAFLVSATAGDTRRSAFAQDAPGGWAWVVDLFALLPARQAAAE
jgi:phytoene synthase